MSYNFLNGIRVLEVAQLAPASLGGYLADMGAEVIKVEGPQGDPVRYLGALAVGSPEGEGFLHLRWNRGKKSVGIDLYCKEGQDLFKRLAADADVVIEGMRAGMMERYGLGYESLKTINPRLVFCSLSGLGSTGPYRTLGAHAPSFDACGGLGAVNIYAYSPEERQNIHWVPIGMHAMGLNAALGTLAALVRAKETGRGAFIEVTGVESAAAWLPDGVDTAINDGQVFTRQPELMNSQGKMVYWPRLYAYETADGKQLFFQCMYSKYWERFCQAIDIPELHTCYEPGKDIGLSDEQAHDDLVLLFKTRSREQWMEFFLEHDLPALPVNTAEDLANDPHFIARNNFCESQDEHGNALRLLVSPVKTPEQSFSPKPAPARGQHSDQILKDLLKMDEAELARLQSENVIFIGT